MLIGAKIHMRLIGSLSDEGEVRCLSAYLFMQGIQNHIDPVDQHFEIWVKDEDLLDQAKSCLVEFRQNPSDAKYRAAISEADSLARQQEKKRLELQKRVVKVNPARPGKRRQPLTLFLIGLCVFVALATNFGAQQSWNQPVFRSLAFNGWKVPAAEQERTRDEVEAQTLGVRLASISRGELWRLITPIFIHFSVFHILFNCIMLFQLGGRVENRYGTGWMATLVIVAAMLSNLVQCLVPAAIGGSVTFIDGQGVLLTALGGMSGVVFAMFGFIWMKSLFDRSSGFFLPSSSVLIIMGFFFFCMLPFSTEIVGNVANWAHGAGLAVGMVTGFWSTFVARSIR